MKKLVMVSEESFFSGMVKSGMAEIVDSLANSLSMLYSVTVVCQDGQGLFLKAGCKGRKVESGVRSCQFSNVTYYTITPALWAEKAARIVNLLAPDILHNFAEPDLLSRLSMRPSRSIYTFDNIDTLNGKERYLLNYDAVSTNSSVYANELLLAGDMLSKCLSNVNFIGIPNGVLDNVLTPEKGLLIDSKYNALDQTGKRSCKNRLMNMYKLYGNPFICLYMGELTDRAGIDLVIDASKKIQDMGGITIVCGHGSSLYEKQLNDLNGNYGIRYTHKLATPIHAIPMLAGADFFLRPSRKEAGCLIPLTACKYGAIPIVTSVGGLADNFNNDNAIIINNGDISSALETACSLYADEKRLTDLRRKCMEQDFSWNTRKSGYIELYESI
jgi:glycogen synthase|nr:MAG TPA: glycogen synthase [Bacteriophage sp.]